jgi:glycosyltransferase involved in cell wall biosynthesis
VTTEMWTAAMKRVLFVTYWYPPQPAAGALRSGYIANHLQEFGWEPVVLTREYPGTTATTFRLETVREFGRKSAVFQSIPDQAIATNSRHPIEQRVRDLVKCFIHVPDDHVAWMPAAFTRAQQLARESKFDAVLSSSPPPNSHFIARSISSKHHLPWIADYRDLWAGPYGPYFSRNYGPTRLRIFYAMERWLLKKATLLTTVTKGHAKALERNFNLQNVEVIPNASDRSIWTTIENSRPVDFRFCYAGQIYPGLRTPDLLFSAVAELRKTLDPAGLAARFDFYGNEPELVLAAAAKYGISDAVQAHGLVDRRTALMAQKRSAALVLLLNMEGDEDPVERANPGSKIFEYAGSGRRILALGSTHNVIREVLAETGIGLFASDKAECQTSIKQLYEYFVSGDLSPVDKPSTWFLTPREIAKKFSVLLDRVTGANQ